MKVTFLRIYNEERNLSMKLYGDRLKKALQENNNLEIANFAPKGVFVPGAGRFWVTDKIRDYLTRFWAYPRQIKNLQSDIYHILDHANAYLLSSLNPARTVVTCHDLITLKYIRGEMPLGYEDVKNSRFAAFIFKRSCDFLPRAARLIADSENTRQDILKLLPYREENIKVIYPGIDPIFKRITDRESLSAERCSLAGNKRDVLLNLGCKFPYKNFAGLLHALRIIIKDCGREVFLIRVGEVTNRHRLLIKKFDLGKYIRIIPRVATEELNILYNLSDLFVFPSLYEGFGWPVVEAMACATPVVSSDKGGLKEVIQDAAYIIDPYDAQNIANGILRVLDDAELRESLVQKGLKRIREFTVQQAAEKTFKIYQEICQ